MNPEQREMFETLIVAEQLYEAVLSKINFGGVDESYRKIVGDMLRKQTRGHLVFAIWNNMDDEQAKHLAELLRQTNITAPGRSYEDILIEFALMYPKLMEKVNKSLAGFFEKFVSTFNRLLP